MKKLIVKFFVISCIFGFIFTTANAKCNFITAEYINELDNPKFIKKIEIRIPKSLKYVINFNKIIATRSENIPPELRRTFRAKVKVIYDFGSCIYNAKVRQKGDWKDHISEEKNTRSLKVNLKEGNILNAVRFNLFLPETRGNLNEVLGTLLLKKLNFISPDTFQVETEINGVNALMLFQEDIQKELLEKNNRREGPLFEGDESLLWSRKKFNNDCKIDCFQNEFEKIMLARVINSKWFLKGKSPENITLSAFAKLQKAYLNYSQNIETRAGIIIFPNNRDSNLFEDYFFILLSMNGEHALRPHNRSYYYNSFLRKFEPIYYDGNLHLLQDTSINENILKYGFKNEYTFKYIDKLSDTNFIRELFEAFQDRLAVTDSESIVFFNTAMLQIAENAKSIQGFKNFVNYTKRMGNPKLIGWEEETFYKTQNFTKNLLKYFDVQKELKIEQVIIKSLNNSTSKILALDQKNKSVLLTKKNIAQIISRNNLKGQRNIYLPNSIDESNLLNLKFKKIEKNGTLIHSKGMSIKINKEEKNILIAQESSSDWILFREADLTDWKIIFKGNNNNNTALLDKASRLNDFGMTGCLNFYKTKFINTTILTEDGSCEDSINIINSSGNINEIRVKNAISDAIDLDFSNIEIDSINVYEAGNDCLDVSGGKYSLVNLSLSRCGDKGISVGEKSNLKANNVIINTASIGVSSKDLSETFIKKGNFVGITNCYEAAQKKQEFGGAKLIFENLLCDGGFIKDDQSIIN